MAPESNAAASTSAAASASGEGDSSTRKRIRKRHHKSRSGKADAAAAGDDSSDDEPATNPRVTAPATSFTPTTKASGVKKVSEPRKSSTSASTTGLSKVNPHKPSYITRPASSLGRKFTVSVAIPGSIVLNAQSPELQSRLAAHIARACAIFNVDEIVVFDEGEVRGAGAEGGSDLYQHRHNQQSRGTKRRFPQEEAGEVEGGQEDAEGGGGKGFDPHTFLARVLQYLETPQYLRKALFPMHRDLRLAGLMPPLDCPHHLRFEDHSEYREGVTIDPPHWARNQGTSSVYVNIGLRDPIEATLPAGATLETGTRVTVKLPLDAYGQGEIVSPREPVERHGWYWGYTVRLASSFSAVLTGCPFNSYDLVIGTSERGHSLSDLALASTSQTPVALPSGETVQPLPREFEHALVVFGGLSGLEVAVEMDEGIKLDRHTAKELFDAWVNVVDGQGSRTIRTEEAIMIALARVGPLLQEVAGRR